MQDDFVTLRVTLSDASSNAQGALPRIVKTEPTQLLGFAGNLGGGL